MTKHREKVFLSEMDQYLFSQGTHYEIYKKLGAHPSVEDGIEGIYFAVWAPNAKDVYVVGDWNGWSGRSHMMQKLGPVGIWGLFIPEAKVGHHYKYCILTQDGRELFKADPYANYAGYRPENSSIVADLTGFEWSDTKWMQKRAQMTEENVCKEPLAIYECHIGSFMRHPNREGAGFYTYREFADRIVDYLKEMKYTHVELIGIAEHPFDGSWGYQVTGYYAPTSRYGTPQDFMYLVNKLHKAGIGVILDWVPAHFASDAHGLAQFDGQCIYEHPDSRRGEHPDWGTKIFNYGKREVSGFLISNVFYWMKEYHIDGVRVDAVASMLYLDYGKRDGQWLPNILGGRENLDAIEFFKHLNSIVKKEDPSFLTIAEESTAWPGVTKDAQTDGLGFTYKWNMGWMHDFCEYMKQDPLFRKGNHYALTFAMTYNDSEKFILPLSHDEVVHLKCSMVNKMPGYMPDKYANLRAGYAFMFGHPGKKLLFMGQEFGQEREWSEERELDWFLLSEKHNSGMQAYVGELLRLYRKYPAFYEFDHSWDGFEWMHADDTDNSVYSFVRKSSTGRNQLLFVVNMTPMRRDGYRVPVPKKKKYRLLLNSAEERFGGNGEGMPAEIEAEKIPYNNQKYSLTLDLPPLSAAIYLF